MDELIERCVGHLDRNPEKITEAHETSFVCGVIGIRLSGYSRRLSGIINTLELLCAD